MGAQADGADGRVVEWPILVGLGSGHQGWTGQESTPPHPLGLKEGAPAWNGGAECLVGVCGFLMSRGGSP